MNLNKVLAGAITKGTAKATRKPIVALRSDVALLKREVADLKRLVRDLRKAAKPALAAEPAKPVRIRPTGKMVRKLRQRLGLTQVEMAKIIGVSGLTVSHWELSPGRVRLRQRTLAALARVRAMGKREAKASLASVSQP